MCSHVWLVLKIVGIKMQSSAPIHWLPVITGHLPKPCFKVLAEAVLPHDQVIFSENGDFVAFKWAMACRRHA